MIVALIGTVLPVVPASAEPPRDETVLANGVRHLVATLDGLAATPELATPLPMTRRSPSDILGFPGAISMAVSAAVTELEASDLSPGTISAGDADISIGTPVGGKIPITITVEVARTEDVPVLYADIPAPEDLDGDGEDDAPRGGVVLYGDGDGSTIQDITATLTVALPLTFDTNAPDDPAVAGQIDLEQALSLAGTATVGVAVVAGDDEIAFTSRYGFTDVDVTGSATLDLSMAGTFTDPDGVGGIRPSEWRTTLLDDLIDLRMTNPNGAAPDVDISLVVDSELIDGDADGTLSFTTADPGGTNTYVDDPTDDVEPAVPVLAPEPELARFANVTADDALAALAQLSTAVSAMQGQIDVRFPMLAARLSDAYDPAGELTRLVEEQGSAAIVCGRANTLPPSGAELPGSTWYCQALTSQDATSVTWSAPDGVTITGATDTTTVGTSPTSNVVVAGSPDEPALELSFDVATETGGTATFAAKPRFRSVQELEATLEQLGDIVMSYDPATASLLFSLAMVNDPEPITSAVDVGDALYMDTHLRNVSTAREVNGTTEGGLQMGGLGEPVTVDVGEVTVRTGFGLLLQDDISLVDAGTPVASGDSAPLDRYVASVVDGPELAVADVAFSESDFGLGGTVGYLEVDLTADTFSIAGSAPDAADPVLSADLSMPGSYAGVPTLVGLEAGTLDDTLLLRHLLTGSTMRDNLVAGYDLAGEVSLIVAPAGIDLGLDELADDGLDLTVSVDWAAWPLAPPVVTTSDDYATWIERFDIVPSATGTHTGADGDAGLTDANADLLTAFGFRAEDGDPLDATLHNVTTGASCGPVVIDDATTLSCATGGLVGGTNADPTTKVGEDGLAPADNDWSPGDVWEVRGDPAALRGVVYEGLYDLANGLALTDAEAHRARLPLVGLRPADMTPQFATIRDTVAGLLDRLPALAVEEDPSAPVDPLAPPPAASSLQGMAGELEDALDAIGTSDGVVYGDATVELSMASLENPGTPSAGDVPHLVVSVEVPVSGAAEAPIRIDLGAASALDILRDALGRTSEALLSVTYSSTASLQLAVPLSLDVPVEDLVALAGSGIADLKAEAASDALAFTGSLGALGLVFGTDAVLEGAHRSPTGTHNGEVVDSGSHTPTLEGTAGAGTTATSVSVAGVDFRGFDGAIASRGTDTCTVSAAAVGIFTCAFSGSPAPTWAKDDAFSITSARTDALVDGSGAFAASVAAGMTAVNDTQDGATCAVTVEGAHVLTCQLPDGGAWAAGDAYRIVDGATLVDTTRVDPGATTFTQLFEDVVLTEVTITAGDGTATCTPTAFDDTTISCALDTGAWSPGTDYRIDIGDPETTLVDETTRFDGLDLEGMILTNTTDGATCLVAATTRHTVTCEDPLDGTGSPKWDVDDAYRAGGIGIAGFHLASYTLDGLEDALIADYVADLAGNPGGAEVTCSIPGTDISRAHDACALLSVELNDPDGGDGRYLGLIKYAADIAGATSTTDGPTVPQALDDAAAGEEPIEWSLLSTAFTEVKRALAAALEGTLADEPFPLIGLDVSAGTKLEAALDELELLIADKAETDAPAIVATTTMTEARTAVETFFTEAFDDVSVEGITLAELLGEVDVTFLCDGEPCTDENIGADIDDARVTFTIGYNIADDADAPGQGCATCKAVLDAEDTSLAFDIGLDGLPIAGSAGLTTKAGWSYDVDLGIDRVNGPYIGSSPDSGQFELGANVGLADASTACTNAPAGFSATRCAELRIGLFKATVYDGDGTAIVADNVGSDRSQLDLKLSANLTELTGDDGKVGAADLIAGTVPSLELRANATANVDLAFRTAVDDDGSLPSLEGQIHVGFSADGYLSTVADVAAGGSTSYQDVRLDNLAIDLGSFINSFVVPIAEEVKRFTEPFKPIIDLLRAPIPVLSELAKMTGNAAVTILSLIQQAGYDTRLVENILDMVEFASSIASGAASGLLGLGPSIDGTTAQKGGFVTKPKDTAKGPCGATNAQGVKQPKDCARSATRGGTTTKTKVTQLNACNGPCTGKELTRTISRSTSKPKLTGTALTFPFLNDANQIFGMLMGEGDAVLVRFDAGTLNASAGMSVSWGPFMAGPVPIDISLGATFSFSARFAMGYDTRGLLNMLRQQPEDFDPAALLDGVYIDDLDASGADVPEITLALTVTAGASVSVKIFKVGLEGGVTISVNFNLNDPDRDGRLRIEEIRRFGPNPLCLFEVSGALEFFLRFFVEIDLKFWTKRWSVTLFQLRPPISLFEVRCDPPPPELARLTEVGGRQVLRLNTGQYFGDRNYQEEVAKEKYVLRQIGPNRVSVEAFGLYEEHDVAGRVIWADMGSADDTLQLLEGTDRAGTTIPFTTGSVVLGGLGNDRITTGDGIDEIDGGAGSDTVSAGGGDDTVDGGDDADGISGGLGDDILRGGGGDDSISGDAGRDVVHGGAGDDDLTGGPGLDERRYLRLQVDRRVPGLLDGADVVTGGAGPDTVRGHVGDDVLLGDVVPDGGPTDTALRTALKLTPLDPADTGDAVALHALFSGSCSLDLAGDDADRLEGDAGDDLLLGGAGVDQLDGGQESDHLCGTAGDDTLEGDSPTSTTDSGDDTLDGGSGNDRLHGRAGDDTAAGGPGDDLVDGGEGADDLSGGLGSDAVLGGPGHDTAYGDLADADITGPQSGSASVCSTSVAVYGGKVDLDGDGTAGASDDGRLAGFTVVDGLIDLDGATGTDGDNGVVAGVVVSLGALQMANGNLAAPWMVVGGNADCIFGDAGHDALFGGADDDRIFGDVGDDHIEGGVGDDWLRGAQGDDEIHGDAGEDELLGDSGDDRLFGGDDPDLVRGGLGDDVIEGNGGPDEIHGDTGVDHIVGGSGVAGAEDDEGDGVGDRIFGGPGDDVIAGDNASIATDGTVTFHDVGSTDATLAGPDVIDGAAGADRIRGQGEDDTITAGAGDDDVEGNGGADDIAGGAGADRLLGGSAAAGVQDENSDDGDPDTRDGDRIDGGPGADVIVGDNALLHPSATVTLLDVPTSDAEPLDAPDGAVAGDDHLIGAGGADRILGQGGDDLIDAGTEDDHAEGGAGDDVIVGGAGHDYLIGGTTNAATLRPAGSAAESDDTTTFGRVLDGDDTISGDAGNDLVLGDDVALAGTDVTFDTAEDLGDVDGDDTLYGGSGDDRIWGQRGDDEAQGDGGHDTILGDLATVTAPPSGLTTWPGGAPRYAIRLATPDTGGSDRLYGGDGDDRVYGGADDDLVEGGIGDDHLEGNGGSDRIHGHSDAWRNPPDADTLTALAVLDASDQDDLIGGSSSVHPGAATGAADAGDDLVGDDGHDVMIGDDGDVDRIPAQGGATWAVDAITGGHRRDITLFDRARTGADLMRVSGDDTMLGGAQNDRMYGQGGDDHLRGEDHEDQLQGNQGGDWLEGNDGDDDIIGGSSDATSAGVGDPDGADRISGGAGQDVIAGDNARILRISGGTPYLATLGRFSGFQVDRWVTLHDLAAPAAPTRAGADVIVGGADADLAFGQDGDDLVFGGGGSDYLEGNGGTDQIVGDRLPAGVAGSKVLVGAPDLPASLLALEVRVGVLGVDASSDDARDGVQLADGQDDMIGGSSKAGHRDARDVMAGDGGADMVLGDNGTLVRPINGSAYRTYAASSDPTRVVRHADRFDVGVEGAASGPDLVLGGGGNDAVWGQDGDDELWGEDGDDELVGELGADRVYGGNGDDALLGDRGGVVNTRIPTTGAGPLASSLLTTSGPPFLTYRTFLPGEIDRRVDLTAEEPGAVGGPLADQTQKTLVQTGLVAGGNDLLRGGPGADVLHGGAGHDVMNGDSGGDALFGYGGADVLWGGRGNPDPADPDARGTDDRWVDHLFGGRGGGATSPWPIVFEGADVLDYRPRTAAEAGGTADPQAWSDATAPYDDPEDVPVESVRQHHHGVDWMYGGWDRDVMQANLEAPGPNDGDRMIDWSGVYNLYTACSPDYGGYNAVRTPSPGMETFLHGLAYARGVGQTLADVSKRGTSAYEALGFVYKADVKANTGKPYPDSPGHLTTTACTPEP